MAATHGATVLPTAARPRRLHSLSLSLSQVHLSMHIGITSGHVYSMDVGGVFSRWETVVSGEPIMQLEPVISDAKPGECVCEAGRPAEQAASYRAAHELFSSLGAAHDVFLMEGLMGLNTAGWAFDLPDEDEDEGEDDDESNSMCSSTSEEDDEA